MSRNVLYTGNMETSGDRLKAGESLINGNYRLTMQLDANLVLYDTEKPIWASNTAGSGTNCYLVMQTDGNLVIYPSGSTKAIWASNTNGKGNGFYVLVLQNDRNLVIYTNPIWSTKTNK